MAKQQKQKAEKTAKATRRPRLKGSVKKATAARLASAHDDMVKKANDLYWDAFYARKDEVLSEMAGKSNGLLGRRAVALAENEARKVATRAVHSAKY